MDEMRNHLTSFNQQMIQRFQESQLNSLQVTHKFVEANNKWHESTKDLQNANIGKLEDI